MAVLLILIPVCFFAAERIAALCGAVFGINLYVPVLCVCACLCGAGAYISAKKKIKNRIYLVCALIGAAVGFLTSGITCAHGILSKAGGGMLICIYAYIVILFFSGIHPKKPSAQILIFTAAVIVVSNVCAALYAFSCEYIYYWDNAIYWTFARDIAGGSIKNGFFALLYDSVLTFDYNYLAALLPSLFAYIFGTSRTVYIFAVVNCYFVPCAVMIYAFSKDILRACTVILLLPMLLFLALTGFVDVVGFALCIGCFMLYNASDKSWRYSFLIGFFLAVLILIRRWYAFFGASFIFAMVADCAVSKRNVKYTIVTAVSAGFILIMFFSPLVENKLLADYTTAYAGYKFSLMTDIRLFARYFGAVVILSVLAGAAWCLTKKDRRAVLPLVQAAVCFMLFTRTQTHGQQHLLLYAPAAAVIMVYTLERLDKRAVCAVLAAGVCVSSNTLVDRLQPQSLSEIHHIALLPDFSMRSRKRSDARQILEIKNTLDEKFSNGRLGVNASSFVINADILKNVQPSLGEYDFGGGYIEELPCVDSRDRDMNRFYDVDYILTASPVQVHLGEDKQKIVSAADECLRNAASLGAAYERTDTEFELDGIVLTVYRRTREVTDSEKNEFEDMLSRYAVH